MKKITIVFAVAALVVVGIGIGLYIPKVYEIGEAIPPQNTQNETIPNQNSNPTSTPKDDNSVVEPQTQAPENKEQTIIGKSVEGRDITAYHFGAGEKEILLAGGIHGGYAWNTALLAYQMMDYLKANPGVIPSNIKVTVIPVLNPDGLNKVVNIVGRFSATDVSSSQAAKVSARFNAHTVDINRNFDCGWKATGTWQNKTVSGGTAPFSEPESAAVRDYAQAHKLTAVIAWYSSGGGVYSSSCGNGILPETQTITDIYAKASGYPAYKNFESYQVSGDMTDWFAKNSVPAIGVLLSTNDNVEWDKNAAGIKALFEHYAQ